MHLPDPFKLLLVKCVDFKLLSKLTAVADAGKKGDELTKLFFKEEYMLNYAIGESYCSVCGCSLYIAA